MIRYQVRRFFLKHPETFDISHATNRPKVIKQVRFLDHFVCALSEKAVPEMIYYVLSGTINLYLLVTYTLI